MDNQVTEQPVTRPRGRPRKDPSLTRVEPVKTAVADPDDSSTVFHIMPQQQVFLEAKESEVAFSSGWGAGKTAALLVALVQSVAGKPGSRSILARRHLVTLNRTTLPMLVRPTGDMPPILPVGSYTWNKTEGVIRVNGGGEIILLGCDDPLRIRSINAGDVFIDEACELEEDQYIELLGRIRLSTGGLHARLATNPAHNSHWLY